MHRLSFFLVFVLLTEACVTHRPLPDKGFGGTFIPAEKSSIHSGMTTPAAEEVLSIVQQPGLTKSAQNPKPPRKAISNYANNGRLAIDSLPKSGKLNGADSMLREAKILLDKYDAGLRKRNNRLILSLLGLLTLTILGLAAVSSASIDTSLMDLFALILLLFIVIFVVLGLLVFFITLFSLILGGILFSAYASKQKLNVLRRRAITLIRYAPDKAPPERRVEYEIRCIRMLKRELSWKEAQRKVNQVWEMMGRDTNHPWYPLLKKTAAELNVPIRNY